MAWTGLAKLGALLSRWSDSAITNSNQVHGDVDDDQDDTRFGDQVESILEDQLVVITRQLKYYARLSSKDKIACSLKKIAMQNLFKIYSLKLRPADLSGLCCLEAKLQEELLGIIDRPYGIQDGATYSGDTIESSDSPLWELHHWSLKLIRVFIENGLLSEVMARVVEDRFTNLIGTIRNCQLKGHTRSGTANNLALIAHCLIKLLVINQSTEGTNKKLFGPSFICEYLFPLACEFAAREYPATIASPMHHYVMFESSGKLDEPDEALAEWSRRSEAKGISNVESNRSDNQHDDSSIDALPSTHACIVALICRLLLRSTRETRDIIAKFLQKKILDRDCPNNDDALDRHKTRTNCEAEKFAPINKIVALIVLKTLDKAQETEMCSFLESFVLPNLQEDCLLVKICKFQLLRQMHIVKLEPRMKIAQAYLSELMKIKDTEDSQDERYKLFVIFSSLASELHFQDSKLVFNTYLAPLERKLQLDLVKKVVALYTDYRIIAPLVLVDILVENKRSDSSFTSECERHMTKVVDMIASELLASWDNKIRKPKLYQHLFLASRLRRQLLTNECVNKLLKFAGIDIFSGVVSLPYTYSWTYFECSLRFPLIQQNQSIAVSLLSRLLEESNKTRKIGISHMFYVTIILGNLGFYRMMSYSLSSSSNNSVKTMGYRYEYLLFKETDRLAKIYNFCKVMTFHADLKSSCIMSVLMSWPSSAASIKSEHPNASPTPGLLWQSFVELALTKLANFEAKDHTKFNLRQRSLRSDDDLTKDSLETSRTYYNLLFALIAAFNHEPRHMVSLLNVLKKRRSRLESQMKRYVKLWLDAVTRPGLLWRQQWGDDLFESRSYILISYQALININKAHSGGRPAVSIKGLTARLNSALSIVSKSLADLGKQAIDCNCPFKDFYVHSIRQLEAIGNFQ